MAPIVTAETMGRAGEEKAEREHDVQRHPFFS